MKIPGAEEIEVRYGVVMSQSEQAQTGIAIGHSYVLIGVGIKAIYMTVEQYKVFYAAMHYTDTLRPLSLRTASITSAPEQSSPVWSSDEEEVRQQALMPPGKLPRPRHLDQIMEELSPGATDKVNLPPIGTKKYEMYNLQDVIHDLRRKAEAVKLNDYEEDEPMDPGGMFGDGMK